jgi:hypothetical protein
VPNGNKHLLATRWIPNPKIGGVIPSEVSFFLCISTTNKVSLAEVLVYTIVFNYNR